jgi:hypothetical protein
MLKDVTEVKVEDGFVLWLKFEDGTEGNVNIKKLLGEFTGVFTRLNEERYFQSVKINPELGTISWPNDVDLCPDVLYAAVKGWPTPDLSKTDSA